MFPRRIQHSLVSLGAALAASAALSAPAGARLGDPPVGPAVDAHHAALLQRAHHPVPAPPRASTAAEPSSGPDALPLAIGGAAALMLVGAGATTVGVRRRRAAGVTF